MKRKLILVSFFLLSFFFTDHVDALTALEVSNRGTDCPNIELAEAKEDGSLNKIECYATYQEAKQIMNNTPNDNLVLLEERRIIDAKYALIDYDQYSSIGYTNVYNNKELSSSISYIAGGNSDDAVFLEVDYSTGRIKIKVSGIVGWIKKYENESSRQNILYDIVPLSWVKSPSYYEITDSEIIHHLPVNVYNTKGENAIKIGKKPTMVNRGNYYSYDGNYFYGDLKTMINDYKNNQVVNAINSSQAYYNYYQYLSFRSKTKYSAANINQYINVRTTKDTSKLKNSGEYFINTQNRYGVNALLMLAIGINESAYGNSSIAQTKNNIFGLNAVDKNPGLSADTYPNVETCISDFGFAWLSGKFLQPGDYRFKGANLGNKSVGLNIKYASDPYWGEKAAAYYYDMDKYFGFQDYENYTIALLNSDYYNTVYPKKDPNGYNVSSSYYQYQVKNSSILVLGEVTGPTVNGNNIWYKILSDPVLDGNLEYYSDNTYYNTSPRVMYNWEKNIVYVPATYFTKITNGGGQIEITPISPEYPQKEEPSPSPTPTPTPTGNPVKSISTIVSEAGYHYDSGKISDIKIRTSVEEVKNKLTSMGGSITIRDASQNEVSSGNMKTGYQITITSSHLAETLTVVIYGDTDGNGEISAVDYVRVKNHIMGNNLLGGCYQSAADVNRDGNISAVDYVNIKNYIMGQQNVISN